MIVDMSIETIGAHFSCIVENRKNLPPGNYAYESARSALYALLKSMEIKRIHVPNYICEAVPEAILKAGGSVIKYPIGSDFKSDGELDIQQNDLILLVNYFGLTHEAVLSQLSHLPKDLVIVDSSQSYFHASSDCLATIYSARKFIPVADGGFVSTVRMLATEESDDNTSIDRYQYLMKRAVGEPELSRELYLQAENSLENVNQRKMSAFSRQIIETADLDFIAKKRRDNFLAFNALSSINRLDFTLGDQVPLCYPLMVENGSKLRQMLLSNRVITPKYWPNITPLNDFEMTLLEDGVFLPVDHRLGVEHIMRIVDIVRNFS